MTCREKLKLEHPEKIGSQWDGGCYGCPHKYGYLDSECEKYNCYDCWDREIPGTENIKKEKDIMNPTKMTKAELLKEIEFAHNHIREMEGRLERMDKYKQYEECADELKAMHTALMNSGFTNEQAYDLLKTMTQAVVPTALRGMGL